MDPRPQNPLPGRSNFIWVNAPIPYFQFPHLSAHPQISHAVFTRHGGHSQPPYAELNTSYDVGDRPHHVDANLTMIAETLGTGDLLYLEQVHGHHVLVVRPGDPFWGPQAPSADAVITEAPGLALLVKQADCQGIILFDPVRCVAAVVHCGWRGNVANILGSVVARMRCNFRCDAGDLLAAIGPCLGPCCAEFVAYEKIFPREFHEFRTNANYFDLVGISRRQLVDAGLKEENIESAGICTRCRTDLFYSYRGEGITGRFGTAVMLTRESP